jgi:hypothetical protein
VSDDLHAACDSRIMALESALRIAKDECDQFRDDIAHATFALMPNTATGVVEADDIVPMIRALKTENERMRAAVDVLKGVWFHAQLHLDAYADRPSSITRSNLEDAIREAQELDISADIGGEGDGS